jgi:hypothetical protein
MQNEIQTAASPVETVDDAVTAQPAATTTKRAKPSKPATPNVKAAAKRVAAKPVEKPAKPTAADRDAERADKLDGQRLAREISTGAVAAYYTSGTSMPFKSASDKFSPLNGASRQCKPSQRQAALLLAIITYGAGNIKPDGSFTRGGFSVPANVVNPKLPASQIIKAQPESGCIGDMRDICISYTGGSQSADAVLKLNVPAAIRYIQAFFADKQASIALAALVGYGVKAAIKLQTDMQAAANRAA